MVLSPVAAAKSVTRLDFLTCSVGLEVVTLVRRGREGEGKKKKGTRVGGGDTCEKRRRRRRKWRSRRGRSVKEVQGARKAALKKGGK